MVEQKHLWIGGSWVPAQRYEPLYNPYDRQQLAEVAQASPDDAARAIEVAHEAFRDFQKMAAHERAEILYQVSQEMAQRSEEVARLIAEEAAKPIRYARTEVLRAVQTYRFAAEEAKRLYGERIPMDAAIGGENRTGFTLSMPLGVVAAITPFNFPLNLVAHKVGPAIAAGNAVVLKPAEQTPLTALLLAEMFQKAGLPDGVLNIIPGKGSELGDVLQTHPLVAKITFTGSVPVGKKIQQKVGLRRLTLELGSNSALIIDRDVPLTPELVNAVCEGSFGYNGQVCISIQRIYIHRQLYEPFRHQLAERAQQLVIGSPMDERTEVTAMIRESEAERVMEWVQEALSRGGVLECGGKREGAVMWPTVLSQVPHDSRVVQEEVFGPVVSLFPFDRLEEAVQMVNDSRYGLNAGVFTPSLDRAFYCIRHLQTGGVLINDIPTFRLDHMPYGGVKDSGVGREGVRFAVQEMCQEKFVSLRWNPRIEE